MKKRDKILIFIIYSLIVILIVKLYIEINRYYIIGIVTSTSDNSFTFEYVTEKIDKKYNRKKFNRGLRLNVDYEDANELNEFYAVKIYMDNEYMILETFPPQIKYGIKYIQTISKEQFESEVKKNAIEGEVNIYGDVVEQSL